MKFAIVGAGVIAPFHARAITQNPNAELIAIADVELDKAKALRERFGVTTVYSDYEEMLKTENIDVVSICTPSGLH